MRIWCLFVFFLAVALLVSIWSIVKFESSALAVDTLPTRACNFDGRCDVPGARGTYDSSFVCCEDSGGFPVSHTIVPLNLMLLFNHFWVVLSLIFLNEVYEAAAVSFGGAIPLAGDASASIALETLSGSLLGDVTNGIMGILLAMLLMELSGWKGLWNYRITMKRNVATVTKHVIFSVLVLAVWLLCYLTTGNFNYGTLIAFALNALAVVFVGPWLFRNDDIADGCIEERYARLRWWWLGVLTAISLSGFGYTYLFNAFYQVWLHFAATLLVLLFAVWLWKKKPIAKKTTATAEQDETEKLFEL